MLNLWFRAFNMPRLGASVVSSKRLFKVINFLLVFESTHDWIVYNLFTLNHIVTWCRFLRYHHKTFKLQLCNLVGDLWYFRDNTSQLQLENKASSWGVTKSSCHSLRNTGNRTITYYVHNYVGRCFITNSITTSTIWMNEIATRDTSIKVDVPPFFRNYSGGQLFVRHKHGDKQSQKLLELIENV